MIYRNLTFSQQRAIAEPKNVVADGVGFYTVWDGDDYTPPEPIVLEPIIVDMARAKLVLLGDNKLEEYESAYAAAYAAASPQAKIVFDAAQTVSSDNPLANLVLDSLGYDDSGKRALFERAAQIDLGSITS
jgi:hypothetical protein